MFALLKKEFFGFFSSLTGYVVVTIFLITTGLFMWIIPGQSNILESGYANLDSFFILAPWLFMFLIPAVTMRLFADEKRTGTMELLLTRPLSENSIVSAKYFAALSIVIISILPTFIYFMSAYLLGNQKGNIDLGGTWGSYIGLFFLAATYVSIGVFCSSLTDNQIIAFLLSLILTFIVYQGFDTVSTMLTDGKTELFFQQLSINRHYVSMSRGVIDSRDIIYSVSTIIIFNLMTKLKIESGKW